MPEYDPRVRHRIYFLQLGAYLLICALAILGFYKQGQLNEQLCSASVDNRTSLRTMVIEITGLAENLILDGEPPTLRNRYDLAQLREFRKNQLNKLEIPVCKDGVW